MVHITVQQHIPLRGPPILVAAQFHPVGMLGVKVPAIVHQRVVLNHPVVCPPLLPLAAQITDQRDPRAVVPLAAVPAHQRVAGGTKHENNPGMPLSRQVWGVMLPRRQSVERGLVVDQPRLVRPTHPEPVARMVRLVAHEGVPRRPALHSVVVGEGTVVPLQMVTGAAPPVQHPDEDPVTAVGAIVVQKPVVVRPALDQHAGGIPRVHFARLDPDAIAQIVPLNRVPAGGPQLQAGVRGVRKVISFQRVVIRIQQHTTIPHPVRLVLSQNRLAHPVQHDSAAPAAFPPAKLWIMEVVREIAPLHVDIPAVPRHQPRLKTLRLQVSHRHPVHPGKRHPVPLEPFRAALLGSHQPGPVAIQCHT